MAIKQIKYELKQIKYEFTNIICLRLAIHIKNC